MSKGDNLTALDAPKDCRKWAPKDLSAAAVEFADNGNLLETSRITGIPRSTLTWHLRQSDGVFVDTLNRCRQIASESQKQRYSAIVDAAQERTLELIPTLKSARDSATVAAIATDKLRLAEGKAGSINATVNLNELAAQFAQLAKSNGSGTTVDGQYSQVVDSSTDNED